jgi:hypothetical protein
MKILLISDPENFLRPSGGESELLNYKEAFNCEGIFCEVLGCNSFQIEEYDACVIFSLNAYTIKIINILKNFRLKKFLIPMFSIEGIKLLSNVNLIELSKCLTGYIFQSEVERDAFLQEYTLPNIKSNCIVIDRFISNRYYENIPVHLFSNVTGIKNYSLFIGSISKSSSLDAILHVFNLNRSLNLVLIGGYQNFDYFIKRVSSTVFKP